MKSVIIAAALFAVSFAPSSAVGQCASADTINALPDRVRGPLVAEHVAYYRAQGCFIWEDLSLMSLNEKHALDRTYGR